MTAFALAVLLWGNTWWQHPARYVRPVKPEKVRTEHDNETTLRPLRRNRRS